MASFEPNFITEPLPNAPSICASAASSAFCLSVLFTDFPDSTSDNCPAICRPFPALERQRKHRNARTMCHICSHGTRGEQNIISAFVIRSEEHTSELQSLMRTSYAVFCLKKKTSSATLRKY